MRQRNTSSIAMHTSPSKHIEPPQRSPCPFLPLPLFVSGNLCKKALGNPMRAPTMNRSARESLSKPSNPWTSKLIGDGLTTSCVRSP